MGASKNRDDQSPEVRLGRLEDHFKTLYASVQALQSELADIKKIIESETAPSSGEASPYAVPCPACGTRFDMLAHHYSIGLFDNMVYVKCPKCNKAWPVKGGAGSSVGVVSDEEG